MDEQSLTVQRLGIEEVVIVRAISRPASMSRGARRTEHRR